MKNLFMAFTAICTGFAFAACTNDIDDVAGPAGQLADPTRGVSLNITKVGTTEMTNVTRATATEVNAWTTADDKNIGVSVYTSTTDPQPLKTTSTNMKWAYNTTSDAWEPQGETSVLFPGDEGVVTAYYPYSDGVDPKSLDIDGTKDYMYALIADNKTVSYGAPQTSLLMHHANAQIRVNLIRKGYAGTGAVSVCTAKSAKFASAGKLNTLTGVVSDYTLASELTGTTGTLGEDVSTNASAKFEALYEWFVPVPDAAAPVIFDATVDGLKLRHTTTQQFEAGKRYTFNLAVTSSLKNELMLVSIDIDPWQDENKEGDMEIFTPAEENAIDLGLPSGLKWAQANLGAEKETDCGLYYMWGDTEGHEKGSGYDFSSSNYSAKGLNSISNNLSLAQDAANVRLGGSWRMPTKSEFEELYNNTNKSWTTIDGVAGYKFVNKTDASKYIFIPASGSYGGTSLNGWGTYGCVWSSTYYNSSYAYYLNFGSGNCGTGSSSRRYCGQSVRGVCQ